MIDAKFLDEIKAREQAATSGPWEVKVKGNTVESHQVMSTGNEPICSAISPKTKNAQFIAHARTDIPALISEVERLTSENTALQAENGKFVNQNRRILNRESKKDQQIDTLKNALKLACEGFTGQLIECQSTRYQYDNFINLAKKQESLK